MGLDLAQQTVEQSQDRFAAGVTNNVEVIQAQQQLASANEQYIASLYAHNIAKVLLARAIGNAEQVVKQYLAEPGSVAPSHGKGSPNGAGNLSPTSGTEPNPHGETGMTGEVYQPGDVTAPAVPQNAGGSPPAGTPNYR